MRLIALLATLQVVTWLLVPGAAGAPPAPPPLSTLLSRHVPVLVLHPAERFQPVPVEGFLADSDLQRRAGAGWETIVRPLPRGGAGLRLDQRLCRAIEGAPATQCYEGAEAAHRAPPVVYGAAFRTKSRIDLQYWLWYPWNVYSPTVPPGDLWQVHEGDWEAVSVVLDLRGRPLLVGTSRHRGGARREWARVARRGQRPVVFVALGSHASFFEPGAHRLNPRFTERTLIRVIEAFGLPPVDFAGRGAVVRPRLVRLAATKPTWMGFAGAWGEEGYVHFPDNEPIRAGLGPVGPAFHEQWRRPVIEALSWPRD